MGRGVPFLSPSPVTRALSRVLTGIKEVESQSDSVERASLQGGAGKEARQGGLPAEPARAGSLRGRTGPGGGLDRRGLERLRPEAAFSTGKGKGGSKQLPS